MSKTTRLFKLMDALRGRRRAVAAAQLAEELSVSLRTVYRDVQTLVGLGAPIDGEAGVGYRLRAGFFLPPLMFNAEELEALVLGTRWVKGQGDPTLARAVDSALAKIATASPKDLREEIAEIGLWAPRFGKATEQVTSLGALREAIRHERKLKIRYVNLAGVETERVIWPVALAFFEGVQLVAAWCELRGDFRHFRADRIARLETTGATYPRPRRELARLWEQQREARNPAGRADDTADRN
ncbi:MAG: YafY family protein [Gammaproteobacteria bacterium]|jgi:predicted DNA-binding transcriptional regulator YafY|uniref:helix-turn-helix transcriptional regulator n=1 Tax=Acidiferrobacter sp. SPIII_3 TaxID=1281578 RepID=UPI000D72AE22|nr:YafY family protein [Acidiferrobacter sp. SPIII_3]AWP23586.1 YafY family transcriptional regulator [Acidiferrobacter sp. SPIII_3]MDA8119411.1 YafY family protein [Gammaproteobacteria bacterium]